jgi:hypothetical protein
MCGEAKSCLNALSNKWLEPTEPSIEALPSDLDRLAGLLERFGRLEHRASSGT